MKPWAYYSTPVQYPWVEEGDIVDFKEQHPEAGKFAVSQWIWMSDDRTRQELGALELEFTDDTCKELGITSDEYYKLDPYGKIIGYPENHEYPSDLEFEKMFEYVFKETQRKRKNRT